MVYEELVRAAMDDEGVVGLVLAGSRGKRAFVGPHSDHDVYLVVQEDPRRYSERFASRRGDAVEVWVMSLAEFRMHAEAGSDFEWNRYTFAHADVVVDKLDGEIRRLTEEKGRLAPSVARAVAREALDAYINSYYRSAKSHRAGLGLAAHLDAAESIPHLLVGLFALHERVRPYNKYLRWELENHPLRAGDAWTPESLLPQVEDIVASGSAAAQQRLFRDAERLAREHGHGDIVDGWEPDVSWLRGE